MGLLLAVALLLASGCGLAGRGERTREVRPPVPARAAYVAEDGHVYVVPLEGGDAHRVSQIAGKVAGETVVGREALTGRWPTWAPDASRLAFVRVVIGPLDTLLAAQLWTVTHDGSDPRKVWEAADREPIYLAWSPNAERIALLAQSDSNFELILIDTTGVEQPRRLAQGNPFYFAWSGDSQSLFLHVGSNVGGRTSPPEMGTLRIGSLDQYRSLGVAPGDFRTPGWSADGRMLAFVADGPDGAPMVSLARPEGGDVTRIAPTTGQTALALTHDGTRIAWSSRSDRDRLAYDGLEVASTDGRRRTRVTEDLVVAFFWSPDGRQLAFITLDRGSQSVTWHVADAEGSNARRLTSFSPSPDQMRLLAFFDQYAISHGAWSPDGSMLVYAIGQPGDQRVFGAPSPGVIHRISVDGSTSARTVVGGGFVAMPVPAP